MGHLKRLAALTFLLTLIACGGPSGPPAPKATAVAPAAATRGEAITVTGTGFGSAGTLLVGGVEAAVSDWSDTQIEATVPAGAGEAWQDVVVTTAGGASTLGGFFVGAAFDGTAAELEAFLGELAPGTAVLLEAEEYDVSADADPFLIDNKSLYGRGRDQTTIVLPAAAPAISFTGFGARSTFADLTFIGDQFGFLAGTTTDTDSPFLMAPGAGPKVESLADMARLLGAPEALLAPQDAAPGEVVLSGVTIEGATGGAQYGNIPLFLAAMDVEWRDVVLDAPTAGLTFAVAGDVRLEHTTVNVAAAMLVAAGGRITIAGSELTAEEGVRLGADTGLTVTGSTVTATDGDIELLGAFTPLEGGATLPTGGPVEVSSSSIRALDADLADATSNGRIEIATQVAPIVLLNNELLRSHGDLYVMTLGSYIGEGDIEIVGNAEVRAGVYKSEDAVNFRPAQVMVMTTGAMMPPRITVEDNAIASSLDVMIHTNTSPGRVFVVGNDVTAGDDGVVGNVVVMSDLGPVEFRDNVVTDTTHVQVIASDLDDGTMVVSGNAFVDERPSLSTLMLVAGNGSCQFDDNQATLTDDTGVAWKQAMLICDATDPTTHKYSFVGNELTVTSSAGSVMELIGAAGEGTLQDNVIVADDAVTFHLLNGTSTVAGNAVTAPALEIAGSSTTKVTFADNVVDQADPVFGLSLTNVGSATLTDNTFTATGTPAADAHALRVLSTSFASTVVATGNTFTGYARALLFNDKTAPANGLDVTINDNVFDFTIDAAPEVAELVNVKDEIDARDNQWGDNDDLATVESYVTLSGDTNVQGGSIVLDPIKVP